MGRLAGVSEKAWNRNPLSEVPIHSFYHKRKETAMNKITVLLKSMLLMIVALGFIASPTLAQDMAKVAPNHVKVVLDNDRVRLLDVQFKAGEKLPMHSHPANVVYSMGVAKLKTTLADGKVVDTEFKAGEARWSDAVTHANEALTDVHVLVVEMKEQKMMKKK
jgi:quercetin dioxygenase-like cupin family protein